MSEITKNVARVQERIWNAAKRAGRDAESVQLVAVSKTVPASMIEEAVRSGVRVFGENYVQEALAKMESLSLPIQWHFIGRLQSNKARKAVSSFSMIHSVDSLKLAQALSRCAVNEGKVMDILIQVNISGEASKAGIHSDSSNLEELLKKMAMLKGVSVKGLMTMPPFFDDPERARPFFRRLRELSEHLRGRVEGISMDELSMGMSGDFEAAIEEGATLVRIGTSIFGARMYGKK
jgi:PLP dependent protein